MWNAYRQISTNLLCKFQFSKRASRSISKAAALIKELMTAMKKCQSQPDADAPVEACIKATEALCKCFTGNPDWFGDYFVDRIDYGLDQDLKPTRRQIKEEERGGKFRWSAGMRRS